jgi:hypothetical protein
VTGYPIDPYEVNEFLARNTTVQRSVTIAPITWSAGFLVYIGKEDRLRVEYCHGNRHQRNDEVAADALDRMEKALSGRYTVTRRRDQYTPNSWSDEYLAITPK